MIDIINPMIKKFLPFAQEKMGFDKPPKLFLKGDDSNANDPLGKTAFYDPANKSITVYITNRHPKDVMRSLSHELVHHTQNCNGQFDDTGEMGEGYAQNNEHLREMEREAYEVGNMCFRDWEDSIKSTIYFEHLQKGEKKMSTKDWKNKELTNLLSEAWGFKFNTLQEFDDFNEGADKNTGMSGVKGDDGDDTYMGHTKKEEIEEVAGVGSGAHDPRKRRKPRGTGPRVEDEEEESEDAKKKQVAESEDTGASEDNDSKTHKGEKDYTTKKGKKKKTSSPGRGEKKGDEAFINEDSGAEEGEHYEDNAMHDDDHIKAIEHHLDALKHDRDYDEDHIDERVRKDSPDRVAGRDAGGRRVKPLEEEEIDEGQWDTPDPRSSRRKPHGSGQRVEDEAEAKKAKKEKDEKKKKVAENLSRYSKAQVREALKRTINMLKEQGKI